MGGRARSRHLPGSARIRSRPREGRDDYILQAPDQPPMSAMILDDRYRDGGRAARTPTATRAACGLARAFHLGRHLLTPILERASSPSIATTRCCAVSTRTAPVPVRIDLMRFLGRSIRDTDRPSTTHSPPSASLTVLGGTGSRPYTKGAEARRAGGIRRLVRSGQARR